VWRHAWSDSAHCPSAAQRGHGAHCPPLFSAAAQRQTTKLCWWVPSSSPTPRSSSAFNFFGIDSNKPKILLGSIGDRRPPPVSQPRTTRTHNYAFSPAAVFLLGPPCSVASFEVNPKPHTGARPSARLCVGLIRDPPSPPAVLEVSQSPYSYTSPQLYAGCCLDSKPKSESQRLCFGRSQWRGRLRGQGIGRWF
jgi:hypothetical protein